MGGDSVVDRCGECYEKLEGAQTFPKPGFAPVCYDCKFKRAVATKPGRTIHPNMDPLHPAMTGGFICGCGRPHSLQALITSTSAWIKWGEMDWQHAVERYNSLPFFGMCQLEISHILARLSRVERELADERKAKIKRREQEACELTTRAVLAEERADRVVSDLRRVIQCYWDTHTTGPKGWRRRIMRRMFGLELDTLMSQLCNVIKQ